MYESGDGLPQDLRLARYWYAAAAAGGDPAAALKARALAQRLEAGDAPAPSGVTTPP
jgi:TPR repeat protein